MEKEIERNTNTLLIYHIVYWQNYASNPCELNVPITDYENGVILMGICRVHFSRLCVYALL